MRLYSLVFRPLEARYNKDNSTCWIRCELLSEKKEYIIGETLGSIIFFQQTEKDIWDEVSHYLPVKDYKGADCDFIVNKFGQIQRINKVLEECLS